MPFIQDLIDIKNKVRTDITQSQLIYNEAMNRSGLAAVNAQIQYDNIYAILQELDNVHADILNAGLKVDVKVTGSVTELICRIALEAGCPGRYAKLPKTWDWVGDYAIMGGLLIEHDNTSNEGLLLSICRIQSITHWQQ